MDVGESWTKSLDWPFPGRTLRECNLVVHSDGGRRQGKCSASAWILEVGLLLNGDWCFRPLAMGGSSHPAEISSFAAEAVALEEATLFIKRIVETPSEPHGKKPRVIRN